MTESLYAATVLNWFKERGPGVAEIVRRIEAASEGEGALIRWDGMRRLAEPFQHIRIPLDNDGNLVQQLAGLTKWCVYFSRHFWHAPETPRITALAYVARQVGGSNYLLNQQTSQTRAEDESHLNQHIEAMPEDNLQQFHDKKLFQNVAAVLKGTSEDPALVEFLKIANAAFYIETGVSALVWWKQEGKAWINSEDTSPWLDYRTEETAMLLAANAYGNNHGKLLQSHGRVLGKILAPLTATQRRLIMNERLYKESLIKAKAAQPSFDKSTPSISTPNRPVEGPPRTEVREPKS